MLNQRTYLASMDDSFELFSKQFTYFDVGEPKKTTVAMINKVVIAFPVFAMLCHIQHKFCFGICDLDRFVDESVS